MDPSFRWDDNTNTCPSSLLIWILDDMPAFLPHQPPRLIHVALISVYLSKACSDLSRPLPDCL